ARVGARAAVARDRGNGRRPHRHHRGLPREGNGRAARGRGGRSGTAARLGGSAAARRPRRRGLDRGAAARPAVMHRSEITIDLAAARSNVRRLLGVLGGAQVWAVVKANAYGHGASDIAGAALGAGASALCVATDSEALALRRAFPAARIIAMGPALDREVGQARDARIELVVSSHDVPPGVRVHLKLDTGMGRWGVSELTSAPALEVVGLMSHLATADTDSAYAEWQIDGFRAATAPYTHLERHIANSAAALRYPS